jgi:hypothetical protein
LLRQERRGRGRWTFHSPGASKARVK